jgi:hypothetical protein
MRLVLFANRTISIETPKNKLPFAVHNEYDMI